MHFIPKIQYFEDDGRSMELTFRTENFVPNLSTKERSGSLAARQVRNSPFEKQKRTAGCCFNKSNVRIHQKNNTRCPKTSCRTAGVISCYWRGCGDPVEASKVENGLSIMPLKPVGLLGSEPQVCIHHEILHAVQHQRIGDTVLFGVLRYIALEEAEVEDMNFRIVLHGELGKGVAVGIFNEQ